MHSLAHRARLRRLERSTQAGQQHINLVPLVDILTSIVFFSLLTYRGELLAELTAYDLTLPPAVVSGPGMRAPADSGLKVNLVVRIAVDHLQLTHAADGGVQRAIAGVRGPALDTLSAIVVSLRQRFPASRDARVVPADDVAYDDVVHVLETLRGAGFAALSLDSGAPVALTPR